MKKYNLFIYILFILAGCDSDFLDRNPLDQPSNEAFWKTEKDALAAATGCYEGWFSADEVLYFDCASDNSHNPYIWEGWQLTAKGNATPNDYADGSIKNYMKYDKIVRCNNFLENIHRPEMDEGLRERLTAEVRFLRAWDYFLKVTLYGDVPLVTKVLDVNEANLPRDPKSTVVEFILNELSEVAGLLPVQYTGENVGRITRGAALAVKARMEIFEGDYAACATTCEQIMALGYDLFPDYKGLFKAANENNVEIVLDVQYVENLAKNWILGVMPPASVGGWSSMNPTQALVDAYECIDGKTIQESPLYDVKEPYQNRDPRLAVSIIYPGCLYEGSYFNPIDINDPTGDYYAPYGRTKTGYHPRKYIDDLSDYADIWNSGTNVAVIRYAEILLMFAESRIELNRLDNNVYDAIDRIRTRAGMPPVDRNKYSSQAALRELVRRERRIELALEGIRWFDICRWKIGEEVMPGQVYGAYLGTVDPNTGALSLNLEEKDRIRVEIRNFDPDKNYLWPIPQSVIDATPAIVQNPKY